MLVGLTRDQAEPLERVDRVRRMRLVTVLVEGQSVAVLGMIVPRVHVRVQRRQRRPDGYPDDADDGRDLPKHAPSV